MREIKFRAWDKRHSVMKRFNSHKSGLLYAFGYFEMSSGYDSYDSPTFDECIAEHVEIMQYTGIKDKNGVEIYEGDIVRWTVNKHWWTAVIKTLDVGRASSNLYAVELKHNVTTDASNVYTYEESDTRAGQWTQLTFLHKNTVILGNIYENPEVLR